MHAYLSAPSDQAAWKPKMKYEISIFSLHFPTVAFFNRCENDIECTQTSMNERDREREFKKGREKNECDLNLWFRSLDYGPKQRVRVSLWMLAIGFLISKEQHRQQQQQQNATVRTILNTKFTQKVFVESIFNFVYLQSTFQCRLPLVLALSLFRFVFLS